MRVYTYRAALWCEDCGDHVKRHLPKPPHVDEGNEFSYDSDEWPKGPSEVGECDYAAHCTACGAFLENRLTDEGVARVAEATLVGEAGTAVVAFYKDDHPRIRVAADRLHACQMMEEASWEDLCELLHVADKDALGIPPH